MTESDSELHLSRHDELGDEDGTAPETLKSKRILSRNLPFCQSKNKVNVVNEKVRGKLGIDRLKSEDWFHVFLRLSTFQSVLICVVIWTTLIIIFAGFYIAADKIQPDVNCGLTEDGLSIISFESAFAFSLETTTTVGYGLPGSSNAYFESCPELQVVIYFQMLFSLLFNAFLFAFFFARLSRCESRGTQVVFSDKAIIKKTKDGRLTFNIRLYDIDSQRPLVEAHIRFYVLKKNAIDENASFELMRTTNPNDDLGGMLYVALPCTATHYIDSHSPIRPRTAASSATTIDRCFIIDGCGMDLRDGDAMAGDRDAYKCVVCGETYGTVENLQRHISYTAWVEKCDGIPEGNVKRHLDIAQSPADDWRLAKSEAVASNAVIYDEFRNMFETDGIEILAVFEAIEPLISGTFQALQSYCLEDIVFGHDFAPCLKTSSRGAIAVDLEMFHNTVPVPEAT